MNQAQHQPEPNRQTGENQGPPPRSPGEIGGQPGEHKNRAPGVAEMLLKSPDRLVGRLQSAAVGKTGVSLFLVSLCCLLFYGLIVGLFSGGEQLWAAPAKAAAGLLLSALLCFPSLYIFGCLSGAEARGAQVAGLLLGSVALTAILLVGFGPAAWVFTVSTESIGFMGFLHLLFLLIGLFLGLRFLFKGFSLLGGQQGGYLRLWSLIFVLVTLQMTTALRPLLGTAHTVLPQEKKFFLAHWSDCLAAAARCPDRRPSSVRP